MHGTHKVTLKYIGIYVRYNIAHICRDRFDIATRAQKLSQQFLVDWVWIGEERLRYVQWVQASDCVEQRTGYLYDSTPNPDVSIPRSPVLLPSSFIGGPRFIQQK